MNTWRIDFGWRQLRGAKAPCGCVAKHQTCHYESPMSRTGIIECEGCGATWGDYDGDEWVHGDRAPDAPPPVEAHPNAPGDCELSCCL